MMCVLFNTSLQQQLQQKHFGYIAEANGYITQMEQKWNWKFPPGYNPNVKSIRLCEDPVLMNHRPLAWYLIIGCIDLQVHFCLRRMNFTHRKPSTPRHHSIFPPSFSHFSSQSGSCLSYWYRPPTLRQTTSEKFPTSPIPLVISHSIGVGLHSYLPLLDKLVTNYPDLPIFCIENLHVSMRVVRDIPTKEDVCEGVRTMLKKEGYEQAVFLGHSIGTMTLSYVLHHPSTRRMIAGLIFLDPIVFLLHLPAVAHNFLYRVPSRANEWLIHSFVSREAGIAWSLCRHFFWFQGVTWKEEIDTTILSPTEPWRGRTIVMLAGEDLIVPVDDVWDYLTEGIPIVRTQKGKTTKSDMCKQVAVKNGVEVVRYPFLDHGAMIFKESVQWDLCEKIRDLCSK